RTGGWRDDRGTGPRSPPTERVNGWDLDGTRARSREASASPRGPSGLSRTEESAEEPARQVIDERAVPVLVEQRAEHGGESRCRLAGLGGLRDLRLGQAAHHDGRDDGEHLLQNRRVD